MLTTLKGNEKYLITEEGEVYSTYRDRYLKKYAAQCGYYMINIKLYGEATRPHYIHRLVAETFIPKIEGKTFVNHKDGNKLNNSVENLEWCTNQENLDHAWATGLCKHGEDTSQAKLTEQDVVLICEMFQDGLSVGDVQKEFEHIFRGTLLNIRARRTWKRVSKNYVWKKHTNRANKRGRCNDYPERE